MKHATFTRTDPESGPETVFRSPDHVYSKIKKELFVLSATCLSMFCYWTYETSSDEGVSSFLHSASPEKSSGIVQNQTREKTCHRLLSV